MEVPEGNDFSSTPQVSKDCSDLCLQVTLQNDLVSKETVVLRRWERSNFCYKMIILSQYQNIFASLPHLWLMVL